MHLAKGNCTMTNKNDNATDTSGIFADNATEQYKTFSWYDGGADNPDEQMIEAARDVTSGLSEVLGMIESSLMEEDDGMPGCLSKSAQFSLLRMAISNPQSS
jgi:hypothetical protein